MIFKAQKLAMGHDEETNDQEELGEDLDVDTESDQEGSNYESNYIPTNIQGSCGRAGVSCGRAGVSCGCAGVSCGRAGVSCGRAGVSCGRAGVSNSHKTLMHKQGTKGNSEGQRNKGKILAYEFCPLPHCPPILHLLTKHFCQHLLLPECHGQPQTPYLIHCDSVNEAYLYCKNSHLCEVWGYLWTNWYTPDKWKLWAWSAYPHAIPWKRTTMVVKAMWRNLKRLVLHLHNRPRVDFATFALVTKALPLYRRKLLRILDDPRKGWAGSLTGEQILIKKAWLALYNQEAKGDYDTNILWWTCSCGTQKYHLYLLCKHLVKKFPLPPNDWWTTVVRHHTPPFYDILDFLSAEERA